MTTPVEAQGMPPLPEKLARVIQWWAGCGNTPEIDTAGAVGDIHAYARSYAAAQVAEERERHWIAVDQRLPDRDGMRCIVVAPGALHGDLWPVQWSADNQSFDAGLGWFERDEVTHWMPLPDAPGAALKGDSKGGA